MATRLPPRFATRMATGFGSLLLVGILTVVYLWYAGLPALGLKGAYQTRYDLAAQILQLQADVHLQRIGDSLRERRGDMVVVAENRVLAAALRKQTPTLAQDFSRVFDRLQRAYPDAYTGMMLLDRDGKLRVASDAALGESLPQLADLVAHATQPGVVELIEQVTTTQGTALAIVRQLVAPDASGRPGTEPVGLLVALLDIRPFLEISHASVLAGGHVLLRDNDGLILNSSGPVVAGFAPLARVANGFEGVLDQTLPGGEAGIVVYRYFQLNGTQGWTLLHYTTLKDAIGRLDRLVISTLLAALLAAILGIVAIFAGARRLTRPLSELARVAQRFGEGQRYERFHHLRGESREVSQLGDAFNVAADLVAQAQSTLEAKVSERTREAVAARDQLLATLDALPDLLFEVDVTGRIYSYHSNKHVLLAAPPEVFLGKRFTDVLPTEVAAVCVAAIEAADREGWSTGAEYMLELPEGKRWFEASVAKHPVAREMDETGETGTAGVAGAASPQQARFVFLARDITARKRAEDEVLRLALFDPLTGLANRRLMLDRLNQARLSSERSGHFNGLLLIDLDHFKDINDTLGHDVGDQLLIEAARRFTVSVREGDTVARLGGDEFVLILNEFSTDGAIAGLEIERVVDKIRHELSRPYALRINRDELRSQHVTLSVGICPFRDASISGEELLRFADTAMYQAKHGGRNSYRFYDPSMQEAVMVRAALEEQLREAVAREQFVVYFQPLVNADGSVHGAELLVRWQHPTRGLVGPAEFIAQMELSGLILPLGHWVLREACATLARWSDDAQLAELTLAVNVSARQMSLPDFVEETLAVVGATGVKAQLLKLELTESLLQENTEATIHKMSALKAAGIRFALDDFGTGYSSLSYLKRLPLHQLKIDRSFVRDMLTDSNDLAIAQLILGLGKTLGLTVLAEGVETAEQHAQLMTLGCHAFQGYLFGKPMPVAQFEDWVRQR